MPKRNWTREELILTFSLYCKLSFGKLHSRNPDVIKLSNIIDRTPSAVVLKLFNFSSFDPELKKRGIKGMGNASKLDKIIFDEFHKNWDELLLESELLNDYYSEKHSTIQSVSSNVIHQIGEERIATTKIRVNQHLFRKMILSNYDEACSICNLDCPPLLVASHILPWSKNEKERLNPHNGLCLCSIHDKAFDKGLITIKNDFTIIPSRSLFNIKNGSSFETYFGNFIGKEINMPRKFFPSTEFLAYHRENIFLG